MRTDRHCSRELRGGTRANAATGGKFRGDVGYGRRANAATSWQSLIPSPAPPALVHRSRPSNLAHQSNMSQPTTDPCHLLLCMIGRSPYEHLETSHHQTHSQPTSMSDSTSFAYLKAFPPLPCPSMIWKAEEVMEVYRIWVDWSLRSGFMTGRLHRVADLRCLTSAIVVLNGLIMS